MLHRNVRPLPPQFSLSLSPHVLLCVAAPVILLSPFTIPVDFQTCGEASLKKVVCRIFSHPIAKSARSAGAAAAAAKVRPQRLTRAS